MRRTVVVVGISDGCSFRIGSGRIVVLSGVPPCDSESPPARQVRQRLEEMLLHRHVQMEEESIDPQGRVIAQVWADGEEINQLVVAVQRSLLKPPEPPPAEPPPIPKIDVPVDDVFSKREGDSDGKGGEKKENEQ